MDKESRDQLLKEAPLSLEDQTHAPGYGVNAQISGFSLFRMKNSLSLLMAVSMGQEQALEMFEDLYQKSLPKFLLPIIAQIEQAMVDSNIPLSCMHPDCVEKQEKNIARRVAEEKASLPGSKYGGN